MSNFQIASRSIGPRKPIYIVAEMSGNHGQSFQQASEIVRAAREAGADAIKLQTYTADTLTIPSRKPCFVIGEGTLWSGRTLHDLYSEAYTPWEWQPKLMALANKLGMDCFSTPFDDSSVDFLEQMQVPAYKIASFELVDDGLLKRVARTGKPVIMSTGMATLDDIDHAVQTLRDGGCTQLTLLKCTSAYPCPPEEVHLRAIPDLATRFEVPVGLSDHTLGIAVPVAAIGLGACLIEKHFTISRSVPGPDAAFSLEPHEFRAMVDAVRTAQKALGEVLYGAGPREAKSRAFRRSLFVVSDVRKGEPFTRENLRSIRPGYGLPPRYFDEVLGCRATSDVESGTPLTWELVEKPVSTNTSRR